MWLYIITKLMYAWNNWVGRLRSEATKCNASYDGLVRVWYTSRLKLYRRCNGSCGCAISSQLYRRCIAYVSTWHVEVGDHSKYAIENTIFFLIFPCICLHLISTNFPLSYSTDRTNLTVMINHALDHITWSLFPLTSMLIESEWQTK